MNIPISRFRANIFKLLDQISETGEVIEITRKGEVFKVFPPQKKDKLKNLVKRDDVIQGDPDDLADIHWDINLDLP